METDGTEWINGTDGKWNLIHLITCNSSIVVEHLENETIYLKNIFIIFKAKIEVNIKTFLSFTKIY